MAQELNPGKPARYERFSRLFIVVLILGTVAVELAVPVVAWRLSLCKTPSLGPIWSSG